jgi:hypothetical protein
VSSAAARSERNNGAIESCTDSALKPQSAFEDDRETVPDTFALPEAILHFPHRDEFGVIILPISSLQGGI